MYIIIAIVVLCCCCLISSIFGGFALFGFGGGSDKSNVEVKHNKTGKCLDSNGKELYIRM